MKLEHVAIWAHDLEQLRAFYQDTFGCRANSKYRNAVTGFESYFLSFDDGARLELMQRPDVLDRAQGAERHGLAHIAIRVGTPSQVDALTERLVQQGVRLLSGPRRTGDGYYESVVLDPEGNRLELVADEPPHS